jgi:carboxylesterase
VQNKIIKFFQGPEHSSIHLHGGKPGVLLVHGFPGTPAEMRPLADTFFRHGWSVDAPLLPGFGAQIDSLYTRDASDWLSAVVHCLHSMQKEHAPVMVCGLSMGAALALWASLEQH